VGGAGGVLISPSKIKKIKKRIK
jgi:hypothetical protein